MAEEQRTIGDALNISGTINPPSTGVAAPISSTYQRTDTGQLYLKTGAGNTDWADLGAGGATSPVLISSSNFTNVTLVDFFNIDTVQYDEYLVKGRSITGSASDFDMDSRIMVGGVVQSGATDYDYSSFYASSTNGVSGDTRMRMTLNLGTANIDNAAGDSFNFDWRLINPASTTLNKKVMWHISFDAINGGITRDVFGSGNYRSTSNVVDGIRIYPTAGLITGDMYLYGINWD